MNGIPPIKALLDPVVQVFSEHGGELPNDRLFHHIVEVFGLSAEQAAALHRSPRTGRTELEYRLAWARTQLRAAGLLEQRGPKIWALTPAAWNKLKDRR